MRNSLIQRDLFAVNSGLSIGDRCFKTGPGDSIAIFQHFNSIAVDLYRQIIGRYSTKWTGNFMPNGGRTVFCHIAVLDSFQLNTLGPL